MFNLTLTHAQSWEICHVVLHLSFVNVVHDPMPFRLQLNVKSTLILIGLNPNLDQLIKSALLSCSLPPYFETAQTQRLPLMCT